MLIYEAYCKKCRAPFLKGYKFCKKEVQGNHSQIYISLQSAICVMIGFPIIFSEVNFVEVQKSTKSVKFVALEKRHPMVVSNMVGQHILWTSSLTDYCPKV